MVYRFGSSATGESRPESDVDLVDLASASSTVMRMQVVSRGVALAVFDHAQKDRFEVYVYSSYGRLNEERKAILEEVLREGTVHGR